MRTARFAIALVFGAIALLAVYQISENNDAVVAESSLKKDVLPETVDNFLQVAVTQRASMDAFHDYKAAKAEAEEKASPDAFAAAVKQCKLLRTASYTKCGTFYCHAKNTCGAPCEKLFGSPPKQVVPLDESQGAKFYNVHEVNVKEVDAKERKAKEVHAKELAAKERQLKEGAYKEKVSKEKQAKEQAKKERITKEKALKEKKAKERKHKEMTEKANEKAHKATVLLECSKRADEAASACEEAHTIEMHEKAQEKDAKEIAAAEALEVAEKQAARDAAAAAAAAANATHASANTTSSLSLEGLFNASMDANASAAAADAAYIAQQHNASATAYAAAHAADMVTEFDVTMKGYESDETSNGTLVLPDDVSAAVEEDIAYADSVIPAGGQRRLLVSPEDTSSDAVAEEATAEGTDSEESAAETEAIEEHISTLETSIASDKATLEEQREVVEAAVNTTAESDAALIEAENVFKNEGADEEMADNIARLHASKAAETEARVAAVDSYVSTHRGALHQTSCAEEKKFAFDVCFGRQAYKGQLLETDAAKASRERTEKYKKKMGEDYAVILEANQTYHADLFKEHAAESAVKAAQAKLEKDSDELATAQQELKENEEKAAAAAAEAAKAKEHEAAQAALEAATAHAAVASAANTSDVMEAQAELIEETPQLWHTTTHQTDQGRRLLAHDDSSCSTDTQAAYDHCRSVVDDAYAGCTTLFKNLL